MKNSAYIKTIYATILFVMLLLCSTFANAQSQMKARMVKQETCDVTHDGQATIDLPGGASNYIVKWTYPDGQTSSAQTISGLEHGIYTVKVRANLCPDKVIYSDFVNVTQKGDCSVNVSISVSTASVPCDVQPTATLTASASGGKPPYSFSWRTKQVSSSGSYSCTVTDSDGNTGTGVTSVYLKEQECSQDPNEISGPDGYGDKMMVNTVDKMSYTINFENDPDFATAPASRVTVNYPVPAQHKISSYRMSDFGFGDFVFTVPNNTTSYYKRLDVSDSLGVWVDVTAGIDIVNNELFWIFQSIDPATGFEPQSAQMGFLPVNDSLERGIGYVNFFINPADGLQTKDTVVAMASIVFDDNSPIATNYWTNEFDAVAPTSTIVDVITLPSDTLNCNVVFSSQDDLDGSGVNSIELFVSTNETAYISAGTFNPSDTGNFSLEAGAYYRFISIATDNVGNVETFKTAPDFIIDYNTAPTDILLSNNYFYENDAIGTLVGLFTTIDNDVNYTFNYQFVDGDGSEDNAKFTINNNQLNTNFNFNCYGQQYYYIRVRSVDVTGLYFDKEFELTMNFTNSSYNLHFSDEICQRETYNSLGWTIQTTDSVPGVYTYVNNLQTTLGCDSIRTLTLTIKPVYSSYDNINICSSQLPYTYGDTIFPVGTLSGIYPVIFSSDNSCDSTVNLELIVYDNDSYEETAGVCDNEQPYVWHNHNVDINVLPVGTYVFWDSLTTVNGCDSIYKLTLTVNPTYAVTDNITICQSELPYYYAPADTTFQVGTQALSIIDYPLSTIHGCDSTVTLHLTVNPTYAITDNVTICQSELPYYYAPADTTFQVGTPALSIVHYPLSTIHGCDSIITLQLTVNPTYAITDNVTICQSELPYYYAPADTTFQVGTPPLSIIHYPLSTIHGCDSIVTLNLTVNPTYAITDNVTICQSELPYYYAPADTTFQVGTPPLSIIHYPLSTIHGCDSVITLQLTIDTICSELQTQIIPIVKGWSSISSYLAVNDTVTFEGVFENSGMQWIFDPTFSSGIVIIQNPYVNPSISLLVGVNSGTTPWVNRIGYTIYSNEANLSFTIEGLLLEDMQANITAGSWGLIPVLSEYAANIEDILDDISGLDDSDIIYISSLSNSFMYAAGMVVSSSLASLQPGLAYSVYSTKAFTIDYAAYGDKAVTANDSYMPATPWTTATVNPNYHVIFADAKTLHFMSDYIEIGDVVAAFSSNGLCVGQGYYNGEEGLCIKVYGDDAMTEEIDGMTAGEEISFKLYRPTTGETLDIVFDWSSEKSMFGNAAYQAKAFSKIIGVKNITGVEDYNSLNVNIYPNPTTGKVNIAANANIKSISVYNSVGALVETMCTSSPQNAATIDLSRYSAGIYMLTITTEEGVSVIKKVVVAR